MKRPAPKDLADQLRTALAAMPLPSDAKPGMLAQRRGADAAIAFCVWVNEEIERGTQAETLLDGGARLVGQMIECLALAFHDKPEPKTVDRIFAVARWQQRDDADDIVVRPHA